MYVRRQQRNYLAHIVRKEDRSITMRLMFNCSPALKPGPQMRLLKTERKERYRNNKPAYRVDYSMYIYKLCQYNILCVRFKCLISARFNIYSLYILMFLKIFQFETIFFPYLFATCWCWFSCPHVLI